MENPRLAAEALRTELHDLDLSTRMSKKGGGSQEEGKINQ